MKDTSLHVFSSDHIQLVTDELLALNDLTERFHLTLTREAAARLVARQEAALSETGRIAIQGGLIKKLILAFFDSPYLEDASYEETLTDLLDAFYYLKSECAEQLTDDELIAFMQQRFEESGGSLAPIFSALPEDLICRRSFLEEYTIDAG